eukprot:3615861-Amphidinium_carterae.1
MDVLCGLVQTSTRCGLVCKREPMLGESSAKTARETVRGCRALGHLLRLLRLTQSCQKRINLH